MNTPNNTFFSVRVNIFTQYQSNLNILAISLVINLIRNLKKKSL